MRLVECACWVVLEADRLASADRSYTAFSSSSLLPVHRSSGASRWYARAVQAVTRRSRLQGLLPPAAVVHEADRCLLHDVDGLDEGLSHRRRGHRRGWTVKAKRQAARGTAGEGGGEGGQFVSARVCSAEPQTAYKRCGSRKRRKAAQKVSRAAWFALHTHRPPRCRSGGRHRSAMK